MYINPKGKGKHNILKVGDTFKNTDGQEVTIIEYNSATNVIVRYSEDSAVMKTYSTDLRKGNFRHPEKFTSIVGKRFRNNLGEWATVMEYIGATKIAIEFDGYEGKINYAANAALRNGGFRNSYKPTMDGVGYMGVGKYVGKVEDGTDKVYVIHRHMIARCYSERVQKLQPAYIGCSVDERWHNLQVFADFYINNQFYGLGYHLDKDLLIRGNRVYSPEACTLLPPEINSALASTPESVSGLPLGVNKIDNGYVARLNKTGQGREYLGYYKTAEEAHNIYVKAKEAYIHSLAEKWKGKIEDRAYQALMEWKVYPDQV